MILNCDDWRQTVAEHGGRRRERAANKSGCTTKHIIFWSCSTENLKQEETFPQRVSRFYTKTPVILQMIAMLNNTVSELLETSWFIIGAHRFLKRFHIFPHLLSLTENTHTDQPRSRKVTFNCCMQMSCCRCVCMCEREKGWGKRRKPALAHPNIQTPSVTVATHWASTAQLACHLMDQVPSLSMCGMSSSMKMNICLVTFLCNVFTAQQQQLFWPGWVFHWEMLKFQNILLILPLWQQKRCLLQDRWTSVCYGFTKFSKQEKHGNSILL